MPPFFQFIALLLISNVFMTFAWYGHLKIKGMFWFWAVLISWGIAFFEYVFQVPANRIAHNAEFSVAQLKITQEVITLCVFVPFSVIVMNEPLKLDFLWAGLCMCGAVYFMFR